MADFTILIVCQVTFLIIHILEFRQASDWSYILLAGSPDSPSGYKFLEIRIVPDRTIMSISGVENTAFPLCSYPGPWLFCISFDAKLKIRSIRIKIFMNISFVPGFKLFYTAKCLMSFITFGKLSCEPAGVMSPKASPD